MGLIDKLIGMLPVSRKKYDRMVDKSKRNFSLYLSARKDKQWAEEAVASLEEHNHNLLKELEGILPGIPRFTVEAEVFPEDTMQVLSIHLKRLDFRVIGHSLTRSNTKHYVNKFRKEASRMLVEQLEEQLKQQLNR